MARADQVSEKAQKMVEYIERWREDGGFLEFLDIHQLPVLGVKSKSGVLRLVKNWGI